MKTLKMIALLVFASLASVAQDLKVNQVPAKVISEFQKSYPTVANADWEMKGTHYEVEFNLGKYDHEISYDNSGKIMREKIEVKPSLLPTPLQNQIKNKYPDYKIDKVEVTKMDGKTSYKVEIEKNWFKERNLTFDHSGKLIGDFED